MKTPEEAAKHLIERYGDKDARAVAWEYRCHEKYDLGNEEAAKYWHEVWEIVDRMLTAPVEIYQIASIRDYRVGVSLDLFGAAYATGPQPEWTIAYIGNYGFPGDPGSHHDTYGVGDFKSAMKRWKELVYDYHARALGVNRLKAHKKTWVPPVGNRRVKTDEAFISHRDIVTAAMISRGPQARSRRRWEIGVHWSSPQIEPRTVEKMLIPAPPPANFRPRPNVEVVPKAEMAGRLNELWGATVKMYRAEMGDVEE